VFFPQQLLLPAHERTLGDCPCPPEVHASLLEAIETFTYGSSLFAAAAKSDQTSAMPEADGAHLPKLVRAQRVCAVGAGRVADIPGCQQRQARTADRRIVAEPEAAGDSACQMLKPPLLRPCLEAP
jgi:hypothetical protein